jgi:hypothetical protein
MLRAGMTQGEVAAAVGVHPSSVCAWLRRHPDVAALYAPGCRYTEDERAWLAGNVPGGTHAGIAAAFNAAFPGRGITAGRVKSYIANNKLDTGRTARFEPGAAPANKGRRQAEWMTPEGLERCRATRFKPGHAPGNTHPVGAEVWRPDGYLWRKVAEDSPPRLGWRQVHRLLWEEHHGPVPDGHRVFFRDGDRTNIQIGNLILVPRRLCSTMAKMGITTAGMSEEAMLVAGLAQAAAKRRVACVGLEAIDGNAIEAGRGDEGGGGCDG